MDDHSVSEKPDQEAYAKAMNSILRNIDRAHQELLDSGDNEAIRNYANSGVFKDFVYTQEWIRATNLLLRLGTKRFGPPSQEILNEIGGFWDTHIDDTKAWTIHLLDVSTWEELLSLPLEDEKPSEG